MKHLAISLAVLVLVWAGDAKAYTSGNLMFQTCTQSQHSVDKAECISWVMGAMEMMIFSNKELFACWRSTSGFQARDILINYMKNNPQNRHESTVKLLVLAMNKAIPCF